MLQPPHNNRPDNQPDWVPKLLDQYRQDLESVKAALDYKLITPKEIDVEYKSIQKRNCYLITAKIAESQQELLARVKTKVNQDFVHGESSAAFDEGRSYEQLRISLQLAELEAGLGEKHD